jgi:hypothetical protein
MRAILPQFTTIHQWSKEFIHEGREGEKWKGEERGGAQRYVKGLSFFKNDRQMGGRLLRNRQESHTQDT